MLFIKPPLSFYQASSLKEYHYSEEIDFNTYAEYNYLRPGLASWIRLRHFEVCLRHTRKYFNSNNQAIDFGCADGILLPSLSNYYKSVVGIDRRKDFTDISSDLIRYLGLSNASVMCNEDLPIEELKRMLPQERYNILYLLETLEHVGERHSPWESRINFLAELRTLIEPDGLLVVSVPAMVGPAFLLQRLGLALLGAYREPISMKSLLKAGFLCNTVELEQQWEGGHLGFNHVRMEKFLRRQFKVMKKINSLFQVIYFLGS